MALDTLTTELLDEILLYLPSSRERSLVARCCKQLYSTIQPQLYSSWCYHGRTHTNKSLRLFLRTISTNQSLAAEVITLDLRDWGYNALCGNKLEELPLNWQKLWELQQDPENIHDIKLWKEAMQRIGLTGSRFEIWERPIEEKPDALLALLLPQLPNLTTFHGAFPENSPALLGMLDECRKAGFPVLGKLETLYIMPSSQPKFPHSERMGGFKNLSNNPLGHEKWSPLLVLPQLRTIHIFGLSGANRPIRKNNVSTTSKIEVLTLDAALTTPVTALRLLSVPQALRVFRLTGSFLRATIGTDWKSIPPFYPALKTALARHRDSLEELHLDVRWKAHGWESFKHMNRSRPGPEDKLWCLQEKYVFESLAEFEKLKVLTVNVEGLFGEDGGEKLVRLIPTGLVELNLLISCSAVGRSVTEIRKQILSLTRDVEDKMPNLKKVGLVVVGNKTRQEGVESFKELKNTFAETGVAFENRTENVLGDEGWMTDKKWFLDQVPKREDLPY